MKVYSYIRVSSKGQVEKDGPERQRELIATFAQAQKLTLVGEAFEKGVSGSVEGLERPAFADLLDRIVFSRENGSSVEGIVVERMDRLARDLMVSEVLLAECRTRKIKVFAVDQGMLVDMASDGADPTRVLLRQLLGAVAQWEKAMLVRKLKVARDRKSARMGRACHVKPYGTKPGEQAVIDYLLALWESNPRPSYRKVASSLNLAGLRNRSGRLWTGQQIHGLLKRLSKQPPPLDDTV